MDLRRAVALNRNDRFWCVRDCPPWQGTLVGAGDTKWNGRVKAYCDRHDLNYAAALAVPRSVKQIWRWKVAAYAQIEGESRTLWGPLVATYGGQSGAKSLNSGYGESQVMRSPTPNLWVTPKAATGTP